MDERTMYETMKAAFADAMASRPAAPRLTSIDPFDAFDEDDTPVRVIGVYDDDQDMRFIIVNEDASGEIYPVAARSVFRRPGGETQRPA